MLRNVNVEMTHEMLWLLTFRNFEVLKKRNLNFSKTETYNSVKDEVENNKFWPEMQLYLGKIGKKWTKIYNLCNFMKEEKEEKNIWCY